MSQVKNYDVALIGKGAGYYVAEKAAESGMKVAVIDRPPIGGTCMNFGCLPSKTLLYPAERLGKIRRAEKIGIYTGEVKSDFGKLMERVRSEREKRREFHKKQLDEQENIDYFGGEGRFVSESGIEVDGQKLQADKIFIANGARPMIPPVEGLDQIDFLTNENILELKEKPESITIIGGGYIAMEYAWFLSAFGIDVTIIEMNEVLMQSMEPEISELLESEVRKYAELHLGATAERVERGNGGVSVLISKSGDKSEVTSEKVFVATGRVSNADNLALDNTGIETDERGYVKVDQFMETTQPGVFALGDITGRYMFKHVANEEARIAWHNSSSENKRAMEYHAVPMAVYGYPEIATAGMTEEKASEELDILTGTAEFNSVSKGFIMKDEPGLVKAVVEKRSRRLLGLHVIGPEASILLQEAVNVIANKQKIDFIIDSMHTFPSLSEIILKPLLNLEDE